MTFVRRCNCYTGVIQIHNGSYPINKSIPQNLVYTNYLYNTRSYICISAVNLGQYSLLPWVLIVIYEFLQKSKF